MNRILTLGLVAAGTALLTQPIYANNRDGHGGKGGGGGRGPHISAPVHVSPQAHVMRSAPAPHFSVQSAPRQHFQQNAPRIATQARSQFAERSAHSRTFTPGHRTTPSVAFGGHVNNNNVVVSPQSRFTQRGDLRNFRPPGEMSRSWDRNRIHEWNHHHFWWSGGNWVVIDGGYAPYYYGGYDAVPDYYTSDYSPTYWSDDATAASAESTAARVQQQLVRDGYNPGPVDGVIGPQTRDAIANFQRDHGLPVSGQIDGALLQAMRL